MATVTNETPATAEETPTTPTKRTRRPRTSDPKATMATVTNEAPATAEETPITPTKRTRRSRRSDLKATITAPRRGRSPRLTGDALVANLAELVDRLIKENRELKRALARVEKADGGANLGQATKTLSGIQRRLNRALVVASKTTRRRRASATQPASTRSIRKVTDPEVLERRRQTLAKARAARRAKRQATT